MKTPFCLAVLLLSLAAGAGATPPSDEAARQDFWSWFSGEGKPSGAYKPGDWTCATVHDVFNSNRGKSENGHPPRVVEWGGQRWDYNFVIVLGAGPCMYTDEGVLPSESLIPHEPAVWQLWRSTVTVIPSPEIDVQEAIQAYYSEAEKAAELGKRHPSAEQLAPVLRRARDRYWAGAVAMAFSTAQSRNDLCARIKPGDWGCADKLAKPTPEALDELYAAARAAQAKKR